MPSASESSAEEVGQISTAPKVVEAIAESGFSSFFVLKIEARGNRPAQKRKAGSEIAYGMRRKKLM